MRVMLRQLCRCSTMMCHAQQLGAKIQRTIDIMVTRRQLLVDEDEDEDEKASQGHI
jgi:hypothetical protein